MIVSNQNIQTIIIGRASAFASHYVDKFSMHFSFSILTDSLTNRFLQKEAYRHFIYVTGALIVMTSIGMKLFHILVKARHNMFLIITNLI